MVIDLNPSLSSQIRRRDLRTEVVCGTTESPNLLSAPVELVTDEALVFTTIFQGCFEQSTICAEDLGFRTE